MVNSSDIHKAVIDKDTHYLQKAFLENENLYCKNYWGHTPYQLAKFLGYENCMQILYPGAPITINVENRYDGCAEEYSRGHFQTIMGIEYTSYLQFKSEKFLNKVLKWCFKNIQQYFISEEERWRSAYYAKEVESGYTIDMSIKWINKNVGYGVISNIDISEGTYIGEYVGELITQRSTYFTSNNYLWEYAIPYIKKTPYLINAKYKGNYTRYINHSDSPNLKPIYIYNEGLLHICFVTIKDIHAGQQLLYDYGPKYWKNRKNKEPL